MGKKGRLWQDLDYFLSYFEDTPQRGRKEYYSYVESVVEQGRRNELSGGELVRSLGG